MKLKLLRLYRQYWKNVAFGAYLCLILFFALQVARLINIGLGEQGQIVQSVFELPTLVGGTSETIPLAGLGVAAGLLVLITLDQKARPQGLVLLLAFGVVMSRLLTAGELLAVEEFSTPDLAWTVPGLLVGFVFGGGSALLQLRSLAPQEFRRAPRLLTLLLSFVLLIALVETHVQYPELIEVSNNQVEVLSVDPTEIEFSSENVVVNSAVAAGAVISAQRFISYDDDTEFFVLGPPGSGKSLLLIGAYIEALSGSKGDTVRRSEKMSPSQDLMKLIENLDQDTSEWIVEATGQNELRDLEFNYPRGSLFRQNVRISALDYAGEHLRRLPDALDGDEDQTDQQLSRIATEVEKADTHIFLIDAERYINDDGLHLAEYFSILQNTDSNEVVLVVTKSDIFADMYWEEYERAPQANFAEFRAFVESQLTNSEQFETLLRQTPTSEIHPVYYETEFNDDGERVPYRDDTDSVVTVGFGRLLSTLGS